MARERYESLQEVFDDAWTGLRGQGFKKSSLFRTGQSASACGYRGVGGRRCAIGHCIPDSMYSESLEGGSVNSTRMWDLRDRLFSPDIQRTDLRDLQNSHDCSETPEHMEQLFRRFAGRHGLTVPEEA